MQVHIEFELTVSLAFWASCSSFVIAHCPISSSLDQSSEFSHLLLPDTPRTLLFSQFVRTRACLTTTYAQAKKANQGASLTSCGRNAR